MHKLLIVEDEERIRKGLAHGINWAELGFEVASTASNGEEALHRLAQTPVDIVLTDVRMPVMNGVQLAKEIQRLYPNMKTIILSGYGEFSYAQQSIEAGVFAYLLKPLNKQTLKDTMLQAAAVLDEEQDRLRKLHEHEEWIASRGQWRIPSMDNPGCAPFRFVKLGVDVTEIVPPGTERQDSVRRMLDEIAHDEKYKVVSFDFRSIYDAVLILEESAAAAGGIEKILQSLNEAFASDRIAFSAGSSGSMRQMSEWREKEEEASAALEQRFYTGARSNCRYEELPVLDPVSGDEYAKRVNKLNQSTKRIFTAMRLDPDPNQLANLLDQWMSCLREPRWLSAAQIKHLIRKFADELLVWMSENGREGREQLDLEAILNLSHLAGVQAHLQVFLHQAAACRKTNNGMKERNVVQQVKEYVQANYAKPISLHEISERYFINGAYFSALFSQETGETFTEYVTKIRMEQAKSLLREDIYKVYEVAERVGYNDYRSFCRSFKRLVGVTPLIYKQRS